MKEERKQEEVSKRVVQDNTPIDINTVVKLTQELLMQTDPSGELLNEFNKLIGEGKIIIHSPQDDAKSVYKDGCVNFTFDGTVNTAHTLVHEFMHYYIDIKSSPTNNRGEHTLLNEYISIYYENAFIKLMSDKGIIKCGEISLVSKRLAREYDKDSNNAVLIILELCQELKNTGSLDKQIILDRVKQYFPDVTNEEKLWEKVYEIIDSSYFNTGEMVTQIMYRFNTILAMQTPHDLQTEQSIFKLADLIIDRQHDHLFMEQYEKILQDAKERPVLIPDEEQSRRENVFDRIPLSSCLKVKDESDIPGNFTSVTGEYLVPAEGRTGFYKLNSSFGNNPDLREMLGSVILKSIGVPAADIILVHDDKANKNGCISMNILQDGENFLDTDDYNLWFELRNNLPKEVGGLERFITLDLQYYAQKYNFPPEVLEYRRKFLIEYAFASAFLGNDDIKTANCQMIYNERNSTVRNPEYYDMGMAFEGPMISTTSKYPRYFFNNKLDMDVLRELYEKYPSEVADISTRVSQYLNREYLQNLLNQPVFSELGPETLQNIWSHMGTKISYITRQNELLYGMSCENNSFVTSLDEVDEVSHGQDLSLLDKAKKFLISLKTCHQFLH